MSTVEEKIRILEDELAELLDELESLQRRTDRQTNGLRERVKEQIEECNELLKSIKTEVKTL